MAKHRISGKVDPKRLQYPTLVRKKIGSIRWLTWGMTFCNDRYVFRKDNGQTPVNEGHENKIIPRSKGELTNLSANQCGWSHNKNERQDILWLNYGKKRKTNQCKIHGPALSVSKRIVTLSPDKPALTTSRRTGFTKLYTELPALRTTSKACYKTSSEQVKDRRYQVEIRTPWRWKGCCDPSEMIISIKICATYWASNRTSRDRDLDNFVRRQNIDRSRWQ